MLGQVRSFELCLQQDISKAAPTVCTQQVKVRIVFRWYSGQRGCEFENLGCRLRLLKRSLQRRKDIFSDLIGGNLPLLTYGYDLEEPLGFFEARKLHNRVGVDKRHGKGAASTRIVALIQRRWKERNAFAFSRHTLCSTPPMLETIALDPPHAFDLQPYACT
jgi:hypothetical protein